MKNLSVLIVKKKLIILIALTGLIVTTASGQITFSSVESKLITEKNERSSELICLIYDMSLKFQLKREVTISALNDFFEIDSQNVQVIILSHDNIIEDSTELSITTQKQLLDTYSKYELDYFMNELDIEIINPNSQWVMIKSKGWFIWYFKIGSVPVQVENQTKIQLFATTVIEDKILIINAPILSSGDFRKAGLIVNEMMESVNITINKTK